MLRRGLTLPFGDTRVPPALHRCHTSINNRHERFALRKTIGTAKRGAFSRTAKWATSFGTRGAYLLEQRPARLASSPRQTLSRLLDSLAAAGVFRPSNFQSPLPSHFDAG